MQGQRGPAGRCAEIIVLDQFSRNLFRGSARAFAQDGMALALAQEAVAAGADQRMTDDQRYFTYMPYMHAESLVVHEEALRLFTALGHAEALRFEKAHRDVIERFGRYPARNAVLGRESTAEELSYLENNKLSELRGQKIHERTHARRKVAPVRIKGIHPELVGLEFFEENAEAAGDDVGAHDVHGAQCHPETGEGETPRGRR